MQLDFTGYLFKICKVEITHIPITSWMHKLWDILTMARFTAIRENYIEMCDEFSIYNVNWKLQLKMSEYIILWKRTL